jgi:hypothetical protein
MSHQAQPRGPYRPRPSREKHLVRNVVLSIVGVFVATVAIGAWLGGGKTAGNDRPAAAATHTATPPPAPVATTSPISSTVGTAAAVVAWDAGPGGKAFSKLAGALGAFGSISSGDFAAYGQACEAVGNDVTDALGAPPMPYRAAERPYRRALAHYGQGAADCQAGVSAQSASTIEAAGSQITMGTADLGRATAAIKRLES